jgi:hypothetical protein
MTDRLKELAVQALSYLALTLAMIAAVGAVANSFLPIEIAQAGTIFMAIIYILLLLIATARAFDSNNNQFTIEKIFLELERVESLTTAPWLDELRKTIDELQIHVKNHNEQ